MHLLFSQKSKHSYGPWSLPINVLITAILWVGLFGCVELNDDLGQGALFNGTTPLSQKQDHDSRCTTRSVKSGNWRKGNTWDLARVPQQGDTVCIQRNHRIHYNISPQSAQDLRSVIVHGSLSFANRKSTQLRVHDLKIMKGGQLKIGQINAPLPSDITAEIVFVSMHTHDPTSAHFKHQLGLFSMGGDIELFGRNIDRIADLNADLARQASQISGTRGRAFIADIATQRWNQGDEILLPATKFERSTDLGNETRIISQLNARRLTFDRQLQFNHKRINRRPLTLANLSSNIIIRSEVTDKIKERGHVMIMKPDNGGTCGRTEISGVRFESLGRTNKAVQTGPQNQNMMYGLHFHQCGTSSARAPHLVQNSVLVDSPGWGFVNHGSEVNFIGNVAYDFTGAGFVAESGNERGEFIDNLAVGGSGINSIEKYTYRRIYLEHKNRIERADLAFHGDGFWISSPFVAVSSNRAIGNHGNGFVWYQTGIDSTFVGKEMGDGELSRTLSKNFFTQSELNILGYDEPQRSWEAEPDRFLISDLPLFNVIDDNYAAANFVGMRVRYARSFNSAFLNAFYPGDVSADTLVQGSRSKDVVFPSSGTIQNTVLQNNEIGLHTSYSTRLRFIDLWVEADGQLVRGPEPSSNQFERLAATGIEMNHHSNSQHLLQSVTVDGYPIGERRSPNPDEVRERVDVNFTNCDEPIITWQMDKIKRQRR